MSNLNKKRQERLNKIEMMKKAEEKKLLKLTEEENKEQEKYK